MCLAATLAVDAICCTVAAVYFSLALSRSLPSTWPAGAGLHVRQDAGVLQKILFGSVCEKPIVPASQHCSGNLVYTYAPRAPLDLET